MKYENLQQAHTLVDGYSQAEQDVLKPFLPALPKQKTLGAIIEDVYEAYMDEEDEANSDRLAEIHYQLTNLPKAPQAREVALHYEDYDRLLDGSIALSQKGGLPWFKMWGTWRSNAGELRDSREMAGEPREVIRNGSSYVQ